MTQLIKFIQLLGIELTEEIEFVLREKDNWENKCWRIGKLVGLSDLAIATALTDIETEQDNLKQHDSTPQIKESYYVSNETLDYLIQQLEFEWKHSLCYESNSEYYQGYMDAIEVLRKLKQKW